VTDLLASFRFLLSDILGIDDSPPPVVPDDLPVAVRPIISDAIARLIDYQGPGYAQLYLDRLHRFARRRAISAALLGDIARLMAQRMCYEDPIRRAQCALAAADAGQQPDASREAQAYWLDDILAALPARLLEVPIVGVNWAQWCRAPLPFRLTVTSGWGRCRLRALSRLRRWRLFSARYAVERVWVERWLHMIERSLVKQPQAAPAMVQTATMMQGYGEPYRQGLADWHAIIDGLAKPTFDGALALPDLAGAVAEARAAAAARDGVRRSVAVIRARAAQAA
jgi:hypothetical protein